MARPLPYPAPLADLSPVDLTAVMNVCSANERDSWTTMGRVLLDAEGRDAFEIHFEPEQDCIRIRFRSAFEFTETRIEDNGSYLQSLKLLQSQLWDTNSSNTAKRAWFLFTVSNNPSLFQMDVVPSSNGDTYLLTQLDDSRQQPARLEDIGLNRVQLTNLKETLAGKNGLVVVAADLPQARRRTARAIAQSLVSPDMKVIIAETPLHPLIPRTTQLGLDYPASDSQRDNWNALCQLGADAIVTTQSLEESLARQVIDRSAEQALVVHSVTTDSPADCLGRLLGLGIRSETLAHCLTTIILQYRARCLCPYCRVSASPDDTGTAWLATYSPIRAGNINDWLRHRMRSSFSEAEGCSRCNHTGYRHWLDIFDVITVNATLKEALYAGKISDAFTLIEQQQQLGNSLLKLAQEGIISLDEAARLTTITPPSTHT